MHEEDRSIDNFSGRFELYVPAFATGGVELDLGCGAGHFAAELAKLRPDRTVLAADVMIGRLRKLARRRDRDHLDNLAVLRVEARFLVGRMLPDASLDRIHLLCPDPWPKGRHRGHRLLSSDFTARLHRVLKTDGIFHFSSDDENYCRQVDEVMTSSLLFVPDDAAIYDVADIKSSFELRWLAEGKPVRHRAWRRLPLPPHTIGH